MIKTNTRRELIYHEKYHNNCHDYLQTFYLEQYAAPKYKKFLYKIKNEIPKLDICKDTSEDQYDNIIVCDQHAVIFSHSKDMYPILATYALNACIGLIMYVPDYKVGAMAHIDGLPGYSKKSAIDDNVDINFDPVMENIGMILNHIRNICKTDSKIKINYYLVGGIFDLSEVMIYDIIEAINKFSENFQFYFCGRNLLGPENQSRNICFDTRTGEITYFNYIYNVEFYKNVVSKENLPANILKAPRISPALLDVTYLADV